MMMTVVGEDRVSAYLDAVSDALRGVDANARAEIIGELSNHLAESQAAGRSAHDVLDGLGNPGDLALMYKRELRPASTWNRELAPGSLLGGIGRWLSHSRRLRELHIALTLGVPLVVIVAGVLTIGGSFIAWMAGLADRANSIVFGFAAVAIAFAIVVVASVVIARVWRTLTRLMRRASEGKAIQLMIIPAWPLQFDDQGRSDR